MSETATKPMTHIRQRTAHDCTIAAAAILSGNTYEHAEEFFKPRLEENKVGGDVILNEYMEENGFMPVENPNPPRGTAKYIPEAFAPRHHAIVRVNPTDRTFHSTVMDEDGKFIDPATGPEPRSYEDFADVYAVTGFMPMQGGFGGFGRHMRR